LITSPLEWQMTAAPVPPPVIPVLAERGGTQLKTPRAVLLVDTRQQNSFHFSRFAGWFSGIEKKALKLGDYSVAGLEAVCAVERKDLSDLVHSCTVDRCGFIDPASVAIKNWVMRFGSTLAWEYGDLIWLSVLVITSRRCGSRAIARSRGHRFPFSAVRHMSWGKNSWLPICIRFICTTGWSATTTVGFS
jgi:hypothetical protein